MRLLKNRVALNTIEIAVDTIRQSIFCEENKIRKIHFWVIN